MKMSDRIGSAVIAGVLRLLGSASSKSIDRMSGVIGNAWFAIDCRHRQITLDNLKTAFGSEKPLSQLRPLARSCFRNLARILFEMGWSLNQTPKHLSRRIILRGLSHYKNAVDRKRGVLLLTLHMGNWELLSGAAAMAKIPVHVVYRPMDISLLDIFFQKYRSRFGARLIPTARSMRKVLRALKEREAVTVLMDQNVDWYEGVFVDFFGKSACTNQGPALVALTTGAPVLPVFLVRRPGGFDVEFGEEIPLIRTGDRRKDLEENTRRYTRILESAVRRFPAQWLWVHQRWKTRPFQPWPREGIGRQEGLEPSVSEF